MIKESDFQEKRWDIWLTSKSIAKWWDIQEQRWSFEHD